MSAIMNSNATTPENTTSTASQQGNDYAPMEVDVNRQEIDHEAKIKELTEQYEQVLKEMDSISLDAADDQRESEAVSKCDKLTKRIELHRVALEKIKGNSNGNEQKQDTQQRRKTIGIQLSQRDIPKCQLKSSNSAFFKGAPEFATIGNFIQQFEYVINSSGKDIEDEWKVMIPLSFPPELHNWVKNELIVLDNWLEATKLLTKKFGSTVLEFEAKRRVLTMIMRDGETANQYYTRFSNAIAEAGYSKTDPILADIFFLGFPQDWQRQINMILAAGAIPLDSPQRNISIFAEEANRIFTSERAKLVQQVGHKRIRQGEESNFSQVHKKERRVYDANQGKASNDNRNKDGKRNVPSAATNNRTCDYCKKIRYKHHYCEEYVQAKKEGRLTHVNKHLNNQQGNDNYKVLSVARVTEDDQEILVSDPMYD